MNNQPNNRPDESAVDSVTRLMQEANEDAAAQSQQEGKPESQHIDRGGNTFAKKPKPEGEKLGPFKPEAPIQGPQNQATGANGPEMPKHEPGSSISNPLEPLGPVNPNKLGPENKKPELLGPEKPEKPAEPKKEKPTIDSAGGAAKSAGLRTLENLPNEDLPEAVGNAAKDTGKQIVREQLIDKPLTKFLNKLYENKHAAPNAGQNVGAGKPAVSANPAGAGANAGANVAGTGARAGLAASGTGAGAAGAGVAGAAGTTAAAGATAGAAVGAGAVTAGIGAIVVAAGAAVAYANDHKKEIGYVLLFLIFISVVSMAGAVGMTSFALGGGFGKKVEQSAGKNNPSINNITTASQKEADKAEHNGSINSLIPNIFNVAGGFGGVKKVNFTNNRDLEYLKSGKIDKYLLEALDYLKERHAHIGISHIVSNYEDMPTDSVNPEQTTKVANLTKNVSAHKVGLAADVSEIDYVYKAVEKNEECKSLINAIAGALGGPLGSMLVSQAVSETTGDLVYYKGDMPTNVPATDPNQNQTLNLGSQGDSQSAVGDASASITETNQKLETLKNVLNELNAKLDQQIGAAQAEGNTDLKNELMAKKQRILELISRIGVITGQLNNVSSKLNDLLTNIQNIQNNLNRIVDLLQNVNQTGNIYGTENGSTLASKTITKVNKINKNLDLISTQIRSFSAVLQNVNLRLENTIILSQNAVNDPNFNIDELEKEIVQSLIQIKDLNSLNIIGGIEPGNNSLISLNDVVSSIIGKLGEGTGSDIQTQLGDLLDNGLGEGSGTVLGNFDGAVLGGITGSNELLRLKCQGNMAEVTPADISYNGSPAKVIPIKVKWQDLKPLNTNVGDISDDAFSTNPLVFYKVYQPQAREKVHQVIKEMLDYPAYRGSIQTYKINQLITYSNERDVLPFSEILNSIYGKIRQANIGLFSMDEAWPHVHIAY